ncbi:hypothetical protein GCM10023148_02870 [Actinokineospora soli]
MLWIAAGALIALLVAWRLHRANHTLQTILREERDRPDPEPAPGTSDEPVTHDRRTPD